MKKLIILALLFFGWKHYYYIESAPEVGPGVLAGGTPYQSESDRGQFRIGEYTYYPRASFEVDGRVLAASRYYGDQKARVSPMDVVLGWGPMSDEAVYNVLDISQSNRSYSWDRDNPPISNSEIALNSSNMHLIPANNAIKEKLRKIKIGDILVIRGYLVDVKSASGWRIKTSVSRTDEGDNSSELVYAHDIEIINPFERIYY